MAKTMKAAVVHEFKQPLAIEEVPVPEVGPGPDPGQDRGLGRVPHRPARRRRRLAGEAHAALHPGPRRAWAPSPRSVPASRRSRKGDRVGVPWLHTACGRCKYCLSGWETLCDAQRNTGYSVNGGFAQYVLADPNYVGHLPDGLGFDMAAPILCAGVTVYKGLKETDTKPGDTVVISGIGGLRPAFPGRAPWPVRLGYRRPRVRWRPPCRKAVRRPDAVSLVVVRRADVGVYLPYLVRRHLQAEGRHDGAVAAVDHRHEELLVADAWVEQVGAAAALT